ncbi:hypothetical protein [Methylobacterium oxalidis]|uniref:Uncharacterized protein n=1 Tax=Methylobacterium oxalidis TaxID=944322 RepID=A0A512JB60_9HYPH|nr:hypothetical protein [Methylobacterium oxalidis]GEP07193.1 hypothetical protein MOX02_52310 [Methylobacterium oxalidis]GLS65795.1 hypothetical protein GCM10007888_41770 [Methylobacterium oxalidis]
MSSDNEHIDDPTSDPSPFLQSRIWETIERPLVKARRSGEMPAQLNLIQMHAVRLGTVFLDCDGVLADFDKGAGAVLGMPPAAFEKRYGLGRFWSRLASTPDFFESLDLLPDGMELYEAVRELKPVILTGLPRGNWAEPQKRRWAARHFPGVEVITTSAASKREHCSPGDALVDDRDKYRPLWEKAGGVFIHHRSASALIRQLRDRAFL